MIILIQIRSTNTYNTTFSKISSKTYTRYPSIHIVPSPRSQLSKHVHLLRSRPRIIPPHKPAVNFILLASLFFPLRLLFLWICWPIEPTQSFKLYWSWFYHTLVVPCPILLFYLSRTLHTKCQCLWLHL